MSQKYLSPGRLGVIVLLAMAGAVCGSAQSTQRKEQPQEGAGSSALTAQLVKTGLYMFSSGDGNSLLRLSANGLILVDGQLSANYEALLKQVTKISRQPIRLLIITDHHRERSGSDAKFIADGTAVLAHENVTKNLASDKPADGKIVPPTKTYDHDFTVKLGGIEVQLMHFGNAHTDGDTVVYFPNLKVVAVGDLLAAAPNPDFSAGGSLVGWGPVLDEILKLDFDVVVPASGPLATRADLEAFRDKIDTLVSRATALARKGVPKDRLMAELKTDDLGWRLDWTHEQVIRFYSEVAAGEQGQGGRRGKLN
jgi:glyoxylase-like metal-dependent hydrolase (beta-lactamase superfamily II)